MNITVPLTDEQAQRLDQLAESLGIDPTELARAACVDLVSQPPDDFRDVAKQVLTKNRELYRRLAQ
jgi:predicted transcriptional regulator